MRLLLLAAVTAVLACEQPTAPVTQAVSNEPRDTPEAPAPEPVDEPEPVEEPEEPEPVEEEPEPSPWLEGWIYLVDAGDEVHYSAEEPDAQLTAAYYDMAAKRNRQRRAGWPFRVIEG